MMVNHYGCTKFNQGNLTEGYHSSLALHLQCQTNSSSSFKQVLSGVKQDEKKKFISDLCKDQKVVAMVGDGINDTAALVSSDIGISMGVGVGAASDASSIVLLGNRLSQNTLGPDEEPPVLRNFMEEKLHNTLATPPKKLRLEIINVSLDAAYKCKEQ